MRFSLGMITLVIFAATFGAHAATYYVGKSGSDGNSCATAQSPTAGNRKLTIAAGAACLSAGDTLIIGNGTYAEQMLNIIPAGTSNGVRTTVKAENNRQVIVQPGSGSYVLTISGNAKKYITIDGLVFDGAGIRYNVVKFEGNDIVGNPAYQFPQFIRFQNNTVRNFTYSIQSGMLLAGWSNLVGGDHEILDNIFDNIGNGNSAGLYVTQPRNLIRGNEFVNIHFCAITVNKQNAAFPDDNIIQGNRFHNIQGQSVIINYGHRNLVYNNLIYNNTTNPTGGSGIYISDTGGDDNEIYNNTIYGNVGIGIDIRAAALRTIVKNNIVFSNIAGNIGNASSTTVQSNNLTTNPSFVNAASADFRLQSTSAAINAGVDLSGEGVLTAFDGTARPKGGAFDIGAYEYTGASGLQKNPDAVARVSGTVTVRPAGMGALAIGWAGQSNIIAAVYSPAGKLVGSFGNVGDKAAVWNTGTSPAGVYLVRVQSGKDVLTAKVYCGK